MTMPADVKHPNVSNVADVSSDAWNQNAPYAGENFEGAPARYAQAVTIAGVVQVRDAPTLANAAGALTLLQNVPKRLLGKTPQRRHATICLSVDGYIGLDDNQLGQTQPLGLYLPAKTIFRTDCADEVWVNLTANGVATWWAELDEG